MTDFWNIIVQSNTFNFAILVVILAVIFVKIDLPGIIEKIRINVSSAIENAQKEKNDAHKELNSARKTVKNTDLEVDEKLKGAKLNAKTLSDEILSHAQQQIKHIEENVNKVIEAEEKKLSGQLLQGVVQSSVELAEKNIIDILKANPELHEKFLEDSISEISKVKL